MKRLALAVFAGGALLAAAPALAGGYGHGSGYSYGYSTYAPGYYKPNYYYKPGYTYYKPAYDYKVIYPYYYPTYYPPQPVYVPKKGYGYSPIK